MFNFSPKGHTIIIKFFLCKLNEIIWSYELYQIFRVVSPQINDPGEEFSKNNISGG